MEAIDAGDVPIERVVDQVLSEVGLKRLLGHHSAACFVLVRSGLAPEFHERLIRNVETVDSTTRHNVAFVVFHGKDSSVVRGSQGWDRDNKYRLNGLSVSNDPEIRIKEYLPENREFAFDRDLGEAIRSSAADVPVRRIARAMDVATTVLLRKFDLPEQALPCLLFVDGQDLSDIQLVPLSPEAPMDSLYRDVLAPLGDEFKAFQNLCEPQYIISKRIREHAQALVDLEKLPEESKALEEMLRQSNLSLEASLQAAENASPTRLDDLIQERDRLKELMLKTMDERLKLMNSLSNEYSEAHDLRRRLTEIEDEKKAAYSEPLTEEKRQNIGRLSHAVNQLRGEYGTVMKRALEPAKLRLAALQVEISKLASATDPVREIRRNVRSIEFSIEQLHRRKVACEAIIAQFASFDPQKERDREDKARDKLLTLGYDPALLKNSNPRAMDVIKAMAARGRIGFSKAKRVNGTAKVKILFLAANPRETTPLDLEEEQRLIETELRGTLYRDSIELVARYAVRPDDLVRYIRAEEPSILHFSGHGASEGIFLRIDGAGYQVVSGQSLTRLVRDRGVQMVVLNACFSSDLAGSLSTVVPTVIGTTKQVGDEAARRFSGAFYRTLGDGHTIGDAFRDGGDSVELHDLPDVYQLIGLSNDRFVGP